MAESRYRLGGGMTATSLTGVGLNALGGTCGLSGNNAVVHIVTESIYNSLRYENRVTYRAVLTLGKTGLGTGGSNSCVDLFLMTKRGDIFVFHSLAANVTYAVLFTGLGTSGRLVGYDLVAGVSGRGYDGLSNESFAANRTLLTLGKTCFFTLGSNSREGLFGVSKNCLFDVSGVIASRAGDVSVPTDSCTGRSLSLVSYLVVTERIYGLGIGVTATILTGEGLNAISGTGRIGGDNAVHCVLGSINYILALDMVTS